MAPLIVIVGPTASGKSDLAIEIAKKFNGEIICADSWTVRRELNVGTAKPSSEQAKQIKHHLLDIVPPCADFTAAVFKGLANKAVDDISNGGKQPIMVGGTGLYIDGVIYDFGFLPEGDRTKRQSLNSLTNAELLSMAKDRGLSTDSIDVRNKRRIIRLLETGGQMPTKSSLRPNTLIVGLKISSQELKARIEKRVDAMLKAGLEREVKNLANKYGWNCEGLKGVGYKEWREYFENHQTLEETKVKIIKSTQDLAKRQKTWFKRNNSIHWANDKREVVEIVTTFLNTKQ